MCLEVPADVVSKDDDEDDEERFGKRPRLNLIPPRMMSQDIKKNKGIVISVLSYKFCETPKHLLTVSHQRLLIQYTGPPKLVVTPTKLTLLDPFHRSFTQSHSEGVHPRHYTKTRAPAISSQSQARNGHLSVTTAPVWTETTAQPARKMGVASLLFHRTLTPKDTLQVQSYTLENQQQQPHTQLQVHSYAREHQPRHLQSKPSPMSHAQIQASTQALSCGRTETQSEKKSALTTGVPNGYDVQDLEEQHEREDKPEVSVPAKMAEAEPADQCSSSQTQTQPIKLDKMETEAPKNKQKVCVISLFLKKKDM